MPSLFFSDGQRRGHPHGFRRAKHDNEIFELKERLDEDMHLKPDPVAVEFLKQFGLALLFVIFGAMSFMRYGSTWSKRKRSSKHKHNDEPKNRAKETSED
ncbi:MAG: hypothetical protein LAO76_04040 [Acidobacteriia bacterium]|nr:hypothetical protein [Terriglobia bacterium]